MRLIDVCDINPKDQGIDDSTEVSFVAMPDVSEDGKINIGNIRPYYDVKKGYTCFREGDVLFAKITPCMENGKGALAVGLKNGIGCGSTEFHVLRPNTEVLQGKWLYYLTAWSAFRKDAERHMSGSAGQKRVPKTYLEKYELQIPTLSKQSLQIDILDHLRAVIELRKRELQSLDELIKARFVEMFGDVKANPYGFEKKALKDTCTVITGNTPSRSVPEYYGDSIEWIKTDNIVSGRLSPSRALEYLSDEGIKVGRTVEKGAILMACIAGSIASIGRVCITDRKVAFNQQISAIVPKDYDSLFLHTMLQLSKEYLVEEINMALKGILSKSKLESKEFIVPSIEHQKQFASFVTQVDKSKAAVQKSLDETQLLFDSLMQEYFG